jgi:broad specificity phosphatase PhoE
MTTRFVFIRHGEARHNVEYEKHGESAYKDPNNKDATLTENGKSQVLAAVINIKEELGGLDHFLTVISSPLSRCIETALVFRDHIKFNQISVIDDLIECQGGGHICNQRKTAAEITVNYPLINLAMLDQDPPKHEEREPLSEVRVRASLLFKTMWAHFNGSGGTILVVSHHDVFLSFFDVSLKNAEWIILDADELREQILSIDEEEDKNAPVREPTETTYDTPANNNGGATSTDE